MTDHARRYDPAPLGPREVLKRLRQHVEGHMDGLYAQVRTSNPDMPWTNDMACGNAVSVAAIDGASDGVRHLLEDWNRSHDTLLHIVARRQAAREESRGRDSEIFGGGKPSSPSRMVPPEYTAPAGEHTDALGAMDSTSDAQDKLPRQPSILKRSTQCSCDCCD